MAGRGSASGTTTSAERPDSRHAATPRTHSSPSCREGAGPTSPSRARAGSTVHSTTAWRVQSPPGAFASRPATRGGCDRVDDRRQRRDVALGSPIAGARASVRRRTGPGTGPADGAGCVRGILRGRAEDPARTVRPWNGTDTRDPIPASSSSSGSRYVNGRSSDRRGTATHTSTGPVSAEGCRPGSSEARNGRSAGLRRTRGRGSSARSVSSQEKPLRPKWPYAAVSR